MSVPSATVAFLFTDIEGSTRLWDQAPATMEASLRRHDAMLRSAAALRNGYVFKTIGDAFCIAFGTATDALEAGVAAQRAIQSENWPAETPIKVRMAVHVGAVEARDDDYFGPALNRVSRLMNAAHGNQLLISQAAFEFVRDHLPSEVSLRSLGENRLKDLARPELIYQVEGPGLAAQFPPIRTLNVAPNNLPQQVTSFVGREEETAEVRKRLQATRLLTLTGAGGTGKTRLSLQVAADQIHAFEDGVWLVELASVADPALVPSTVAETFGVREAVGVDLTKTLVEMLALQKRLVILDNCEHVIDAASRLAEQILRYCPGITLMATSREALRIAGEQTYRVPPLSLPDPQTPQTADSLSQFESVRLFIDRARMLNPSFQVTNETAPSLAHLCCQLDGIPLALELAAARTRALSVPEIARRLDQRFQMLTGGVRTALPRQQTLRALVDWSYELLSEAEKTLFQRLAAFAGGFSISAAEGVCAGGLVEEWDVLDLVTSLVDKSLVLPLETDGDARFAMQETIRQYASAKLESSGDEVAIRDRHLRRVAELVREARSRLDSPEQAEQLRVLNSELEDIRSALRWGTRGASSAKESLAVLLANIGRYWYVRGMFAEGETTTRAGLPVIEGHCQTADRATIENTLGLFAYHRAEYDLSREHLERAADLARQTDDVVRQAVCLNNVANILFMQGEFREAIDYYERALVLFRDSGDEAGVGLCLNNQACAYIELGEVDQAETLGRAGLEARQRVGDPWHLAYSHITMGEVHKKRGNLGEAKAEFLASLELRETIGDRVGSAQSKASLGWVALRSESWEEAHELFVESLRVLSEQNDMQGQLSALLGLARAKSVTDPAGAVRIVAAWDRAVGETAYRASAMEVETLAQIDAAAKDAGLDREALRAAGARWALEDAVDAALA